MKTLNLLLLSSNLNRLGILLRQVHNNDVSLSIPIWERAAEVTDDLTRQFPDLPESFEHSILVHNNLSLAYRDPNTEDLAKAVLHKKKVVELARVMLGRHPHLGEHYQMVDYLSDLAEVLEKANCPEESRESFRGAQREMRKIVQDAQRDVERLPDDEVKHYVLVWTLSRYAKFSRLAGDEDTAAKTEQRVQSLLEQQSKVIQAAQRGVDDSPEDDQKRLKLFHALFDHARLSELAENSQTAEFQKRAELELTRMSAAPDIEGEDLAGRIFKLSEYKGKVVVLDFFADWCGWCRKMYPKQRQLVQAYEGRPFALLGVNVDSPQALEEVVRQKAVTWRCWVDGNSIAPVWRVCGYPTVFLIDHRGIVRKRFVGVEEENVEFSKEFSETLEQLVREAEHARETG